MFDGATSFNGDVSSWDVSSGHDFVSVWDPDMMLVKPSHVQEDPLLWPWHTLTWLPLLLSSSTLRKECLLEQYPSMEMFPPGMSLVERVL